MSAHTKAPWRQGVLRMTTQVKRWTERQCDEASEREQRTVFSDGQPVAQFRQPADARRAVACVNICAGIGTETLEQRANLISAQLATEYTLRQQRDQLLAVLERLTVHAAVLTTRAMSDDDLALAQDVIARVKAGTL